MSQNFFESLLAALPPLVTRKDIPKFLGSYISPKYLANLDSQNKGPKKFHIGQKVVYRKEDFVAWLEARSKN